MSPAPSAEHPKPGEAALRVTDADLVGFLLRDCLTAAERYRLRPRERDVMLLSLCDLCPKDIARQLGLEPSYVRVVRQAVVRRLRTSDGMVGIRRVLREIARERNAVGGALFPAPRDPHPPQAAPILAQPPALRELERMLDTSPEAKALRIAAIRAMAPAERLRQALDFSEWSRQLMFAGLRRRFPDDSDLQLVERVLGRELVPRDSRPAGS